MNWIIRELKSKKMLNREWKEPEMGTQMKYYHDKLNENLPLIVGEYIYKGVETLLFSFDYV